MIEQFIAGRELTVGILGDEALPVGEIIPKHEIYDYECKYTPGMAEEKFPAELDARRRRLRCRSRRGGHFGLKLGGCARIDFRMTPKVEFYCLEANTLPGMTQPVSFRRPRRRREFPFRSCASASCNSRSHPEVQFGHFATRSMTECE